MVLLRNIIIGALLLFVISWFYINPTGLFGAHSFGFTVYNRMPIPYFDLIVHADGLSELREKSHNITIAEIEKLEKENPEFIIIGTGYSGLAKAEKSNGNTIIETPTPEAIRKYNKLRSQGKRVAAIIHTTC